MTLGIIYDRRMLEHHAPSPSHPETSARIEAIYQAFVKRGFIEKARLLPAREVTHDELLRCHDESYLKQLVQELSDIISPCDLSDNSDMFASEGTLKAARLAAGSSIALVEAILKNEITSGFAIVRPPGHHSCSGAYGGFCFYNNAMLAAVRLSDSGKRVYIVDFDLHYCEGSVDILNSEEHERNKLINLFTIHRWDNGRFFPGLLEGRSCTDRSGRIVQVGYNGKQGDSFYLDACRTHMVPHMTKFQPDVIVISAGFDAAQGDPMNGGLVTPAGYKAIMQLVLAICPRIAMILEGGYGMISAPNSAVACVEALLGQ